jgi:argininosuccinate lyase
MKLWSKEKTSTAAQIEQFTVGRDREFDLLMASFDVQGSIAHVTMLGEQGLMSAANAAEAVLGLQTILQEIKEGNFSIDDGAEDIHSQIEFMLTNRIGEAGKMIHTGRSRNDQVALDIKLFLRSAIAGVKADINDLFDLLINKSNEHQDTLIPGYTHLQIAMPSSIGLWLGAYAESLVDDMEFLSAAYQVANKNPLGSAAGYGSSFPLNRSLTTELLGFETLNYNVVYAQMGRGKTERVVAQALGSIGSTLGKMAQDICLFTNQNYGFMQLPDELTTGSSIMPHKKNPDVFELVRAKANKLSALANEITLITANLSSGYHRDLQLIKESFMPAFDDLLDCLRITCYAIDQIKVNTEILKDERYQFLFSVETVNQLVLEGASFRDAYRIVGEQIQQGKYQTGAQAVAYTHEGSIGNLCNNFIKDEMDKVLESFGFDKVNSALQTLCKPMEKTV